MGRLGRYEYPDISLSESVDIGGRIAREFAGAVSRRGLSRALGLSERGGRFAVVIGALRGWGVAEGRGTLRLTRAGVRAASPVSQAESLQSRAALARSVTLFADLAARLGDLPPDDARLALLLEEVTGAGRLEVESRLPAVQRLLRDVLPYIDAAPPAPSPPLHSPPGHSRPEASIATPASAGETLLTPSAQNGSGRLELAFSGGRLSLTESADNIDALIKLLTTRARELRST